MLGINNQVFKDTAKKMTELINYDVNIYNKEGIVIGSSVDERIGTYQYNAHQVIKHKRDYLVSSNDNLDCVTLYLKINGEIIGAVSITGTLEKVQVFAEVIRISIEAIISEKINQNNRELIKKGKYQFIRNLLTNQKDLESFQFMDFEMKEFNMIVLHNNKLTEVPSTINLINTEDENKIVTIFTTNDFKSIENFRSELMIKGIISEIVEVHQLPYQYELCKFIKESYNFNRMYLTEDYLAEYCLKNSLKSFNFKDEIEKKFDEFYLNEMLVETFDAYIKNDLSYSKTAESLFIHKNTLKYRIRRIEELTFGSLNNINHLMLLKIIRISKKDKN
jgi:carbohydrate diacid regulator